MLTPPSQKAHMNSQRGLTTDLHTPLPTRQFRAFLLFFHTVFLGALVLTYYMHWRHLKGAPGWDEALLGGLVAIQILLYLLFFAIPSLIGWPAVGWFRRILGSLAAPPGATEGLPLRRWWWVYIVASVAVVLAESRIEDAFAPFLIAYVGQISALPLRQSVPATASIFAAYLLNRFGWSDLAGWSAGRWFDVIFPIATLVALVLFVGRIVVTSGERGQLILELKAAKRELEAARDREVELAALRERERLARDLHDSLGHSLATLTVQLEAAQRLLATDPARAATVVGEMQKLTRSSMEDLRRSLANLRAPGLGDRPLAGALRALCDEVRSRLGGGVECQVDGGADGLPPDAEYKPGHYGLRGMRERVEGLGGTLTLTARESKGTLVEARVPLIG